MRFKTFFFATAALLFLSSSLLMAQDGRRWDNTPTFLATTTSTSVKKEINGFDFTVKVTKNSSQFGNAYYAHIIDSENNVTDRVKNGDDYMDISCSYYESISSAVCIYKQYICSMEEVQEPTYGGDGNIFIFVPVYRCQYTKTEGHFVAKI